MLNNFTCIVLYFLSNLCYHIIYSDKYIGENAGAVFEVWALRMIKYSLMLSAIILITSLFGGLVVMCIVWLVCGMRMNAASAFIIYRYSAAIFIAVLGVYHILKIIITEAVCIKIRRIMSEQGVTPELLLILKKRVDRSKTPYLKAANSITLASYLIMGEYFDECYKILREIKFENLSDVYQEEYFNVYVYANLMQGNVYAAEDIYKNSQSYFERAKLREQNSPVLHTLGTLEYAKGNYALAEELLMQAKKAAFSKQNKCECNLYLGLCYLKTDRIKLAKAAACEASKQTCTIYQRRNLEKLMKLVECAYRQDFLSVSND